MYVVPLDDRAIGRRLGRTIHDAGGRVLLQAGTTLSQKYVLSLRQRGYRAVYAMNELAADVVADEVLRDETRRRATRIVRDTLVRCAKVGRLQMGPVRDAVDQILSDLRGRSDVAFSVMTLRSVDEYTFTHSVNVCVYSLILGGCLGYDHHDLRRLGVGALLHDIGKVNYADLITRPGPLSPEEFGLVKQHTTDGYEMLRHHAEVDILSAHVAYQHHERLDGSGYPRGLRDESIIDFGRIAAIADTYDALSSDRPYSPALPPHDAMAEVRSLAGEKLDPYLVRRFAERVAVYPTGSIVLLNTGEVGVVTGQTLKGPAHPRVRLVTDERQELAEPREIELGHGLEIRQVLNDYPRRVREQLFAGKALS